MLTPTRSLQVDSGVVVGLNELPIVFQSSSGTGRAEERERWEFGVCLVDVVENEACHMCIQQGYWS